MKLVTLLFLFLTACILTNPELSLAYASVGLELWFQKMIPTLLPFMILSGVMVRLRLTEKIAMLLYPVLGPVFQVRKNVVYCMMLGFLCGFPMGARVTADLYERQLITDREAEYLLAFCNNIGPVYFCSFVLPLLGRRLCLPYLFGMYGIPLLYGLILRYTAYRDLNPEMKSLIPGSRELRCCEQQRTASLMPGSRELHCCEQQRPTTLMPGKRELHCCERQRTASLMPKNQELSCCGYPKRSSSAGKKLLAALNASVTASIQSILTLGGYMILFNLLNLPLHLLLRKPPALTAPLLEITGGLSILGTSLPLYSLLALSFGGLSCIAQTYSCIDGTELSIGNYVCHKVILTLLNGGWYLAWFLLFPGTFLL